MSMKMLLHDRKPFWNVEKLKRTMQFIAMVGQKVQKLIVKKKRTKSIKDDCETEVDEGVEDIRKKKRTDGVEMIMKKELKFKLQRRRGLEV